MKTVYQKIVCLGGLFLMLNFCYAQETPGVISVENGIFIYGGGILPKNGYYLIERKDQKDQKYIEIAKTTVPNKEVELEKLAAETATHFKHLVPLNKKNIKRIYNYIQNNKTDDSLYRAEHTPIIAIAAGTAFLDTNVEKNKTYNYRVTLFNNDKPVYQKRLNTITNTVQTNLPKPKKLRADIVNNSVFLEWTVNEQQDMTLFNVYRAYFGTLDFKKIDVKKGYTNNTNGLNLIAIDHTTEKSSLYKYYIQPVDLYGNAGDISEVITSGKLQAEPIIPITSFHAEELNDYKIKLTWELDKSAIRSNIQVWRSNTFDDGFIEITNLPPATKEFTDNLPEASENCYYYLVIQGGTGQVFKTSKIAVMVKTNSKALPAPKYVSGNPIKDGCEITWQHEEPYTRGFYVYRASGETQEFHQISNLIPVKDSNNYVYNDLDKNLKAGALYLYTIRAENDAYTLGKTSDTTHIIPGKKPKTIKPQNLKTIYRDNTVELFWEDMTDHSSNILGYKVYRSAERNSPLQVMPNDSLNPYKNYFNDAEVDQGQTYTYHVSTIDMFGQESDTNTTSITIPYHSDQNIKPKKPIVYKNKDGVTITWNQIATQTISKVKIYRSDGNKNAKVIKTMAVEETKLIDSSLKKGTVYYYKIAYIDALGKETKTSNEVAVYY